MKPVVYPGHGTSFVATHYGVYVVFSLCIFFYGPLFERLAPMALAAAQAPASKFSHRLGGVLWRPVDTGRQSGALDRDFCTAWRCRLRRPALASSPLVGAPHYLGRPMVTSHTVAVSFSRHVYTHIKQPLITFSGCYRLSLLSRL